MQKYVRTFLFLHFLTILFLDKCAFCFWSCGIAVLLIIVQGGRGEFCVDVLACTPFINAESFENRSRRFLSVRRNKKTKKKRKKTQTEKRPQKQTENKTRTLIITRSSYTGLHFHSALPVIAHASVRTAGKAVSKRRCMPLFDHSRLPIVFGDRALTVRAPSGTRQAVCHLPASLWWGAGKTYCAGGASFRGVVDWSPAAKARERKRARKMRVRRSPHADYH